METDFKPADIIPNVQGCTILNFTDGTPHVRLNTLAKCYNVTMRLQTPHDLFILALIADAIKRVRAVPLSLTIPWLMCARYDRVMETGDSYDLAVVADIINSCGFESVFVLDPHSDKTTERIRNCYACGPEFLLARVLDDLCTQFKTTLESDGLALVLPDAGAMKKAGQVQACIEGHLAKAGITARVSLIPCFKQRNTATGSIQLDVLKAADCRGKHVLIVDDICDGGATFRSIQQQILPKTASLIVTHGIFSRGRSYDVLPFDRIYTSDSWPQTETANLIVVPWKRQ